MKCNICSSSNQTNLYHKDGYDIIKCDTCNFIFVHNPPSIKQLNVYYKKFKLNPSYHTEYRIRNDAVNSLRKIKKYLQKAEMLDVGCGRGYFMNEADRLGFKVTGIDHSKDNCEYIRNTFKYEVINSDFNNYQFKKSYDIVTASQVIEHLINPSSFIQRISNVLKSYGYLYIATPNISSLSASVHKIYYDYIIPPEHLGYFDYKTLKLLLEKNNFKLLYSGTWGYSEEIAGIIKRSYRNRISDSIIQEKPREKSNMGYYRIIKKVKYTVFDKTLCPLLSNILKYNHYGSMLEVIAQKNS